MPLQVLVTFPGKMNLDEFSNRLDILNNLGCHVHLSTAINKDFQELAMKPSKKSTKIVASEIIGEFTSSELKIIDEGLERAHNDGTTELLDSLTAHAVGNLKPNMTQEIIGYYRQNPGHNTLQGASALAEKFSAHYEDINEGMRRIRNSINNLCHTKSRNRKLEKRGGYCGPGGMAQVYVLV